MQNASENILDAVIRALLDDNRDLTEVKLEEAKQLTLELLREGRSRGSQLKRIFGPDTLNDRGWERRIGCC